MVFYLFLLRDIENDLKFANVVFNQILNALSNVASAFKIITARWKAFSMG